MRILTDSSRRRNRKLWLDLMVFIVTFKSISAISWQSFILMEGTGGPRENSSH
jgi:hypothetical protein